MSDHDDLLHDLKQQRLLQDILRSSRLEAHPAIAMRARKLWGDDTDAPLPRWPSGIPELDMEIQGFVGTTALAGESGVGKSMAALGCSITNALAPHSLAVYVDNENAQGDQVKRLQGWCGSPMRYGEIVERIAGRFIWLEWQPGMNWTQLVHWIADRIEPGTRTIHIVLDSVNSIARTIEGRDLQVVSQLYAACKLLSLRSQGAIRVLALSELNGNRDLKGLEGVYVAQLALKIVREPEKGAQVLQMTMLKNRTGAHVPDLGLWELIPERCQLVRYSSGSTRASGDRGTAAPMFGFDD